MRESVRESVRESATILSKLTALGVTQPDYYNVLFFLSFKDMKLMYYVIYYNLTLLHQTNNDIDNVYEKIGRFLQ